MRASRMSLLSGSCEIRARVAGALWAGNIWPNPFVPRSHLFPDPPRLFHKTLSLVRTGQSHMEFTVVEGWLHLLGEWRCQLGSRVPERRGTRVSAFLCS